jgi:integrase
VIADTPHELRHSAATILLARGVPLHVVSELLGHSSIRETKDVYGHLVAEDRRRAAQAMGEALYGH